MFTVDFISARGAYSLTKMGGAYADFLRETVDDVQINSIRDTIINGRPFQVMPCSFTLKYSKIQLISTIAFTGSRTQIVTMAGTAVKGSEAENRKNRSVFRQAICSFTWK
ncbi:hypothetical protein GCM10028821_12310 [Hymenobacter jeollabukensis]